MRDGRVWLGTLGILAIVVAIVGALARPEGATAPAAPAPSETARPEAAPGEAGSPQAAEISPPVAQDLAARLARAADGGVRGPLAIERTDPARQPAPVEPPRPALRVDHPPTAADQLEYAGRLHDWIVIRREDLRRRLQELEQSGQASSEQAERIRGELRRLDESEPAAAGLVEEIAERGRREEAARRQPGSGSSP